MSSTPGPATPFAARRLVVAGLVGLAVALLFVALVRALVGGDDKPTAQETPSRVAQPSASANSTKPTPAPSPNADGYVTTGAKGSRQWRPASLSLVPKQPGTRLVRYAVRVETSVPVDPNTVAQQVQQVLDDRRSWTGTRSYPTAGVHFELVPDPSKAELVVTLESPTSVNQDCPLNTRGLWSCDDGRHVLLNSDRWQYGVPDYPDVDSYRSYLVNHEVGHFLGLGHKQCPGKGMPAPTMMQQSKGVGACRPNPWPTVA